MNGQLISFSYLRKVVHFRGQVIFAAKNLVDLKLTFQAKTSMQQLSSYSDSLMTTTAQLIVDDESECASGEVSVFMWRVRRSHSF